MDFHKDEANETFELQHSGLISLIIDVLGLEGDFRTHDTPTQHGALQKDSIEGPVNEGFNFLSAVGMMWYLCNNRKLDIQMAMSQCARFTHDPKHFHEVALKRVGRYLKKHFHNSGHRLIMKPDGEFDVA